ncbi:MAG: sigma-70 family RNA polymerase sigma factor [Gemmatimonadales bacterium]|jgi:RNA polymerase sigma factor for flagellar operon FliA|nr:sigma-70 family RNA polymerase sigma factor [Gemmatimonadales bacterium]HQW67450.1 sigma-70 family RNA polymerase sigma factor [Gemmatimonadales bacterium]
MPTPQRPNQTSTDALWQRWRGGDDQEARRELLGRYLGLVHHAAREMAPRVRDAVSLEELVSAGSVGLLQAMAGFEPERGLAFSTFAMRRIRGAILDELRARDPLSRVDRAHARRLDGAVAECEQRLGRAPTTGEVASHLGVDHETVHRWRERTFTVGPVSLEGEPGGHALADRIGAGEGDQIGEAIEESDRRRVLHEAMAQLPARERLVLSRSFLEERPLRDIAVELGVTESRVCQLRAQAIARLRQVPHLAHARE